MKEIICLVASLGAIVGGISVLISADLPHKQMAARILFDMGLFTSMSSGFIMLAAWLFL